MIATGTIFVLEDSTLTRVRAAPFARDLRVIDSRWRLPLPRLMPTFSAVPQPHRPGVLRECRFLS